MRSGNRSGRRRWHSSNLLAARLESLESRMLLSTVIVTSGADDGGAGTLRTILQNISTGDTVTFDPGVHVVTLGSSPVQVTKNVTIHGPGSGLLTITSSTTVPTNLLNINFGPTVQIDNIAFANGKTSFGTGGAIYNQGTLTVTSCTFSGNSASTGGAIDNIAGTLTVNNSTFSGNSAPEGEGGAIHSRGGVTLNNDTFTQNSADSATNSGFNDGGAVSLPGGNSVIAGCTFANNTAAGGLGGGLYVAGFVTLNNSTVTGNSAAMGGGVYDGFRFLGTNDTVAGNSADSGGGGIFVDDRAGATSINNTIVAANTATAGSSDIANLIDYDYGQMAPLYLSPTSGPSSNNLIGDTANSGALTNGKNGNIVGVADPGLSPLGPNGGPTQTMALLSTSQAIGHGNNAAATAAGLTTDQRGLPRISDGHVDIGAFQTQRLVGDANFDGTVNLLDLLLLAHHYGKKNAAWGDGDFNYDGVVNFADLMLLAKNWGKSLFGTTVTTAAAVSPASAVRAPAAGHHAPAHRHPAAHHHRAHSA